MKRLFSQTASSGLPEAIQHTFHPHQPDLETPQQKTPRDDAEATDRKVYISACYQRTRLVLHTKQCVVVRGCTLVKPSDYADGLIHRPTD